jgi:hypothetical protein
MIIGVMAIVLIGWAVTTNSKKSALPTISDGQNSVMDASGTTVATNVKIEILSRTSAMIGWTTEFLGTTELYFSTTPLVAGSKQMEIKDQTLSTKHTIELNHLMPSTKYYFSIVSTNPENKLKATVEGEFTTKAN